MSKDVEGCIENWADAAAPGSVKVWWRAADRWTLTVDRPDAAVKRYELTDCRRHASVRLNDRSILTLHRSHFGRIDEDAETPGKPFSEQLRCGVCTDGGRGSHRPR